MSETKHTPGPWEQSTEVGGYIDIKSNHQLICYVNAEDKGNADLITAAPELLETLKKVLELGNDFWMSSQQPGYIKRPEIFEDAMKLINRVEPGFFL